MPSLLSGARLGSYEILSAIGRGGMGEVWKAQDTRLGRDVAIKTLPVEFSSDGDRLARFEREAKLLAALNHPNIASIYGLEKSADTQFLVLELVEGETLAEILKRGPIPVEPALKLAVQIAAALESAHEHGIVHRDLKPSNIKITGEGTVKVLDFGLAKALDPAGTDSGAGKPASAAFSHSPTLSMAATAQGIILGTAAYMAPEQARGAAVDGRADVWAFGCVLYEMLTGRQAFTGAHVTDILASVLARDPDYSRLPETLPSRAAEIVLRCLEKDAKRRWQAIGDVRLEIERLLSAPGGLTAAASAAPSRQSIFRTIFPWTAALLLAAAAWTLKPAPAPEPRRPVRFEYVLPENRTFRNMGRTVVAISPDGRHFVYNTTAGLDLRSMDTLGSRIIPGTEEGLTNPVFSPDGEWVAYFSVGQLKKIAVNGGAPIALCDATNPFGASWSSDGKILFAQPTGILRVSEEGGTPELLIATDPGEQADGPQILPDGKTVLFSVARGAGAARWDEAEIVAFNIETRERKVLLKGGSAARYVPSGHLIYAVGTDLFAVPLDLATLTIGGVAPIVQNVARAGGAATNMAAANFDVSQDGTLVYLVGIPPAPDMELVLAIASRNGEFRKLNVPPGQYRSPRVSPNGRQVAVETIAANGQSSISVYDLSGSTAIRRLTQEGNNMRPVWTPDSTRITFYSDRDKPGGIYWQLADGSGLPERLTTAPEGTIHIPESWSGDGRTLSFASIAGSLSPGGGDWSVRTLSLDKKDNLTSFYDVPNSNQFGSAFSPDGQWIAYASNEGGDLTAFAIYVQPYPPTGVKYEISRTGGAWPVWSPTGAELFYRLNTILGSTPSLHAVTIQTKPTPAFSSEQTLPLKGFSIFQNNRDYDVLPNGREFIMIVPANPSAPTQAPAARRIHAVLNWLDELKVRLPK